MMGSCSSKSNSSGNSGSGSSRSKGGDWTNKLFFINNAHYETPDRPVEISHSELETYFEKVSGTDEQILKASIYKHKLKRWLPKWGGLWHEFTVVESTNWYWSFEKNTEGLLVHRSENMHSVYNRCNGKKRTGKIEDDAKMKPVQGYEGDTVQRIFNWIHGQEFLKGEYHITKSNCHFFASMVYEAVARLENRKL